MLRAGQASEEIRCLACSLLHKLSLRVASAVICRRRIALQALVCWCGHAACLLQRIAAMQAAWTAPCTAARRPLGYWIIVAEEGSFLTDYRCCCRRRRLRCCHVQHVQQFKCFSALLL